MKILGTFRCDYEMEYEFDLSNVTPMLLIITFHSNLEAIIIFSTCQQQGGEGPWECNWIEMLNLYFYLIHLHVLQFKGPYKLL